MAILPEIAIFDYFIKCARVTETNSVTMSKVIIVTAPSGAGKTTIANALLETFPILSFSISACTRPKRPMEIDGKDYHFFTKEKFKQNIIDNAFLEWEEVYDGLFYGTLNSEIERIARENKVTLFDVDTRGAKNIKKRFGDNALSLFIKPPKPEIPILEERLRHRGDKEDSIATRIAKAEIELEAQDDFDYIIVNKNLNDAIQEATRLAETFLEN